MTLIRQCDYCHKPIEAVAAKQLWLSEDDNDTSILQWDFHPKCFENIKVWLGLTFEDKKRRSDTYG